jgi:D-alanyl-D-alanine carboxypeptidase (penicillin-binding protein 5/6)
MSEMELRPAPDCRSHVVRPLMTLLAVCVAAIVGLLPLRLAAAPLPVDGAFTAAIVVDAATGEVLMQKNMHTPLPPASMLKMMTELVVLTKIGAGELALTDSVTVSAHAAKMGGSQVYLKQGEKFTVEDLLRALTIHSANDAATALAEHIAGSVEAFVELMNEQARELGMKDTVFHSVHGLPPGRGQATDLSSAYDMALLCRALLKHPEPTRWASQAEAPFRGGAFTLHNPNPLVGKFPGLDGMKTGYTRPAGFCLTATAQQKGGRLVGVVMGCENSKTRSAEMTRLLTRGFTMFTTVKLIDSAQKPLEEHVAVRGGKSRDLVVAYAKPLSVLVLKDRASQVKLENRLPQSVDAPVKTGDQVGKAAAVFDGQVLAEVPIVALESVQVGSFLQRLFHR